MVTYSESPKTLEEIQATIQKHLGDPGRKKPTIRSTVLRRDRIACVLSHMQAVVSAMRSSRTCFRSWQSPGGSI